MVILVVGCKGMLGRSVMKTFSSAGHSVIGGFDLPEFDLCRMTGDEIPKCDWIINCAAYTNVDGAESNRTAAYSINASAPFGLAVYCERADIKLVHISTDYVFDGENNGIPYVEEDLMNPVNYYGITKAIGERGVEASGAKAIVVRTQSLFGEGGRNFVRSIARKAITGSPLSVVDDQVSCPTYVDHLSAGILDLVSMDARGTYHLSSSGCCSWFTFAEAVVSGLALQAEVGRTSSSRLSLPAKRPAWSVLSKSKYELETGKEMPSWGEGLEEYLWTGDAKNEA